MGALAQTISAHFSAHFLASVDFTEVLALVAVPPSNCGRGVMPRFWASPISRIKRSALPLGAVCINGLGWGHFSFLRYFLRYFSEN